MWGFGGKPPLCIYHSPHPTSLRTKYYYSQCFLILYQYSWSRSLNNLWETDHSFYPHCCITGVQNSGTVCVNIKAMCAWPHGKASAWPGTPMQEGTPGASHNITKPAVCLCVHYLIPHLSYKRTIWEKFTQMTLRILCNFMVSGKMNDISYFLHFIFKDRNI